MRAWVGGCECVFVFAMCNATLYVFILMSNHHHRYITKGQDTNVETITSAQGIHRPCTQFNSGESPFFSRLLQLLSSPMKDCALDRRMVLSDDRS